MAFNYPYGDSQQLNLDWILRKLKEITEHTASETDYKELKKELFKLRYVGNLIDITFESDIILPVAKSYVEAITRLGDYYYAACKDYSSSPNRTYIAKYDTSFNLITYVYVNSSYGTANNLTNDGVRLYADFDGTGYHVSFDENISDDYAVVNTAFRNIAFDDGKRYGILINVNSVVIGNVNSTLTSFTPAFTVNTPRSTLQSATVIDGIVFIPTTLGYFKYIDVETQELVGDVRYNGQKEIENFFKDADGTIKCCGHVYGFDGAFAVGKFDGGIDYEIMRYIPLNIDFTSRLNSQYDSEILKVRNGTQKGFPEDTGDCIILNSFKWFIPNGGKYIYRQVSGTTWEKCVLVADSDLTNVNAVLPFDGTPTNGSSKGVTSNGVYDALALKQDVLTFDTAPTDDSDHPVTSDGIYDALALKQDVLTFDSAPTDGSSNPVSSDGIYDTLIAETTGTITKSATITTGTLDSTLLRRVGNIVNIGARIYGMSDQVANDTFFNISEIGRPTTQRKIMCVVTKTDNTQGVYYANVNSNGNIGIGLSSSMQITQILIIGTYPI